MAYTYATRDRWQAASVARSYSYYQTGMCLNFVYRCIQAPYSFMYLPDANSAWWNAHWKMTNGSTPPMGAPVYWQVGSHGHIAVSMGLGYCRSTDFPYKGRVQTLKISDVSRAWGAVYRGWSRDYAGRMIRGLEP